MLYSAAPIVVKSNLISGGGVAVLYPNTKDLINGPKNYSVLYLLSVPLMISFNSV